MRSKFNSNSENKLPLKRSKYSRIFNTIWIISLLAVFMVQCKKDDFEGETTGVCPEVVSTDPSNGSTDVYINKLISVTFNENMNPATLNVSTFTIEYATALKNESLIVAGTISYTGNTATFTPSVVLNENTLYTGTITTGAKDMAGNSLFKNYVWSFTTGTIPDLTPPTVISTNPVSNATNVELSKLISANFSKAMNPSTINGLSFLVKTGSNNVPGVVTYSGVTAVFTPNNSLTPGATYNVTITNSVEDVAGNAMAADYTWSFTTINQSDVTPPTVLSTVPVNNTTGVQINSVIQANFSELMQPSTINQMTFLVKQGTQSIEGAVTYSGLTGSFTPTVALLENKVYTATITTGVKDLAANAMVNSYTWSFTTIDLNEIIPPSVISTDPANLAVNVSLDKTISAVFSEELDITSINSNSFTLFQGTTNIHGDVSYAGVTAVLNPNTLLLPGTLYTVILDTEIKDLVGNQMENDYTWTFTTATSTTGQSMVDLGSAAAFAILAGSGVTNTGGTIVTGDLGTDPTGTVNGFPPGIVIGDIHAADPISALAKLDLTAAYNDAQGRSTNPISLPGDLSGLTLVPGLYTNSTSVMISTGNLTLDAQGDENAVFILQMGSTLTTLPGTGVILSGGAQAANIFWSVGTSATLGTNSIFYGNILADQSISLNTGAVLNGRALTRIAAVTLQSNVVTKP